MSSKCSRARETDKVRRWNHHKLTTYGIGAELSRAEWSAIGRELLRLGYLVQSGGEFPIVEISPSGLDALRSRSVIMLTKPLVQQKAKRLPRRAGAIECDEVLFSRLRELRKRLADERGVPAYVIFGDATLRQMARCYPATQESMRGIFGVGERKLREFGAVFAALIAGYLETYPRVEFAASEE